MTINELVETIQKLGTVTIENAEGRKKASWICTNRIDPLAREHPILNFIASII